MPFQGLRDGGRHVRHGRGWRLAGLGFEFRQRRPRLGCHHIDRISAHALPILILERAQLGFEQLAIGRNRPRQLRGRVRRIEIRLRRLNVGLGAPGLPPDLRDFVGHGFLDRVEVGDLWFPHRLGQPIRDRVVEGRIAVLEGVGRLAQSVEMPDHGIERVDLPGFLPRTKRGPGLRSRVVVHRIERRVVLRHGVEHVLPVRRAQRAAPRKLLPPFRQRLDEIRLRARQRREKGVILLARRHIRHRLPGRAHRLRAEALPLEANALAFQPHPLPLQADACGALRGFARFRRRPRRIGRLLLRRQAADGAGRDL